jgi:CheY-like chemotaxis protein
MKDSTLTDRQVKSIFVVDDCESHNILLKKLLTDCGYQVHTFNDGYDLLENLKEEKPHLVISDINMPEINGFDLCKEIKSRSESKDIPVMFVSSLDEDEVNGEVEKNGAVGFVQKPFSKKPLMDAVMAQKL